MTGPISDGDARARTLFDAAFDAVVTMDADGLIVEVNAVAEQIFGRSAEEMVGQDLAELMIPEDLREPHRRGLAKYIATGAGRVVDHPVEMPAMRADGTEFPVELAIRRLPVPAPPEPPLFLGFVRDITERLRTEKELRELAAEQAALHRVAALVARGVPLREVVDAVTEEIGRLPGRPDGELHPLRGPGLRQRAGRLERAGRQQRAGRLHRAPGRRRHGRRADLPDEGARAPGLLRGPRQRAREDAARARLPRVGRGADLRRGRALGRADGLERQARALPARASSTASGRSPS